jgi:hypothetical protein
MAGCFRTTNNNINNHHAFPVQAVSLRNGKKPYIYFRIGNPTTSNPCIPLSKYHTPAKEENTHQRLNFLLHTFYRYVDRYRYRYVYRYVAQQ